MKKSRFSKEKIIAILKQGEAGVKVKEFLAKLSGRAAFQPERDQPRDRESGR